MATRSPRSTGTGNITAAIIFFGGAFLILLSAFVLRNAFTTSAQTVTTTPVVATAIAAPAAGGLTSLSVNTTTDLAAKSGSINVSLNGDATGPFTTTFDFQTGLDQTFVYTTTSFKLTMAALPPAGTAENVNVTVSNAINSLSASTTILWSAPAATTIPTAMPTTAPTSAPATTIPTAMPTTAPTSAPATTIPTAMPAIDPASLKNEVTGVRTKVDDAEKANPDTHKNTIGLGTEGFLAEPGVYTCVTDCSENDLKVGSLHRITPDTQYVLATGQEYGNVPEGGFALIAGNYMSMTAGDKEVTVAAGPNASAFLIVRGLYRGDGDRNTTAMFTSYKPAHTLWTRMPLGGFMSQRYLEQNISSAFGSSVNCGDTGCARVLVRYLDLNTGATGLWWVDKTPAGQLAWTLVEKNY